MTPPAAHGITRAGRAASASRGVSRPCCSRSVNALSHSNDAGGVAMFARLHLPLLAGAALLVAACGPGSSAPATGSASGAAPSKPAAASANAPSGGAPAASGAQQAPAAPREPVTVRYGPVTFTAMFWPLYVGETKGFFTDEGVNMDVNQFRVSSDSTRA